MYRNLSKSSEGSEEQMDEDQTTVEEIDKYNDQPRNHYWRAAAR
jgi:hypothetical protein